MKINETTCEANAEAYDKEASSYSKAAIFTWCIVGFVYAAVTWHILWFPGLLIFIPGIFIASIIAAIFFIPLNLITKKIKGDWQNSRSKSWGLLMLATILRICGLIAPIAGSIGYIHLLRQFIK